MTGEKAGAEVESDEVEALEAGTRSERVAIIGEHRAANCWWR